MDDRLADVPRELTTIHSKLCLWNIIAFNEQKVMALNDIFSTNSYRCAENTKFYLNAMDVGNPLNPRRMRP
jgi:hypothetical protein